ncbi:MAG: single-stranded-DNA-specific exonuclease RecJ [bacterium]|nr:single-stranded-DNA-specific exonuclease RecJ [bacterium]
MSVLGKNWVVKNEDTRKPAFERILQSRLKVDLNEITQFHDPFLFKDMQTVVERIKKAIESGEKIMIFGDYDVDGMTAAAILIHTLKKMNAKVDCTLPNRLEDGYGLSEKFIDRFSEQGVKLIITVDCGISCKKEIEKARNLGMETIITDHHTIPEGVPAQAIAIIHPKRIDCNYPCKDLTGAGVALKLAQALLPEQMDCFLDLASMGTVADLGPLTGENRLIVKRGLEMLANTKWEGLKKIKEISNIQVGTPMSTTDIGFQIAPRLNAAGRIGDPYTALNLLLENDSQEKIKILSDKLDELNKERQDMTANAMEEVEMEIDKNNIPFVLIAHSTQWHVGILGLIAGKLAEKYSRPAIILQDFGDNLVASCRGPEYFDIIDAIANSSEYLISFGGHAQAAGFNIRKGNLEEFKNSILKYSEEKMKNVDIESTLEIDCELQSEEINFDLINEIESLAPFGKENSKPIFLMKNLEPMFIDKVGRDGNHLKFSINNHKVIAFRMGQFADKLREQGKIDLVFQIDRNIWKNKESLQLQALDFSINE